MYKIIEVANTHGGDERYLLDLIQAFEGEQLNTGIKFQPFKYDRISTADFEWYPVYQKLFFEPHQWSKFISEAAKTKHVWLDLFDSYGVEVLQANLEKVYGLKLQTSVLSNIEVLNTLASVDLQQQVLIINIASRTMEDIAQWVDYFDQKLRVKELWLEVGFQSYPTELQDSGINKIALIKQRFGKKIVFADHLDGKSEDALWLPIVAASQGADVIEKHVMLSDRPTEYDHFSSITPDNFFLLSRRIDTYASLAEQPFINEKEAVYLSKTEMKPLLKCAKSPGQGLSLAEDFLFRRSGKQGLTSSEVKSRLQKFEILCTDKPAGECIQAEDLKPAKIAVIIACRLKSSRLKSKALLPIGDLTSVEYCIKNALRFSHVNEVILATSTEEQDADLANYTYSKDVVFHRGHPDDVIQRYLDVIRSRSIDVIVRVTADMPFIDDEVLQFLLRSHFESGADYTTGKEAAVGTNLEIINAEALERVKSYFPSADYSEYMTWYFQNNAEEFKLNIVPLPADIIRNYRLTLDYQEDLEMFNIIHKHFADEGLSEFNLRSIIQFLDQRPDVAAINGQLTLKYKTDQELIATLNRVTKINKKPAE
jgi:N,N'-diacetyllegionaminate synthase